MSADIIILLSLSPSGLSMRRLIGKDPTFSINQELNVRFPNRVDFAVIRKKFRF